MEKNLFNWLSKRKEEKRRKRFQEQLNKIESMKQKSLKEGKFRVPYFDQSDSLVDEYGDINKQVVRKFNYYKLMNPDLWAAATPQDILTSLQWFEQKIAKDYNQDSKRIVAAYFEEGQLVGHNMESPNEYYINLKLINDMSYSPYYCFMDFLDESIYDKEINKSMKKYKNEEKLSARDKLILSTALSIDDETVKDFLSSKKLSAEQEKKVIDFYFHPINVQSRKYENKILSQASAVKDYIQKEDSINESLLNQFKDQEEKLNKLYTKHYNNWSLNQYYENRFKKLMDKKEEYDESQDMSF
ncbi:MAG: hypothetical protein ACOCP4_03625 [Candidatus Woesearchaeota archaeon]